jgi:hypothetical protein
MTKQRVQEIRSDLLTHAKNVETQEERASLLSVFHIAAEIANCEDTKIRTYLLIEFLSGFPPKEDLKSPTDG